MGRCRFRLSTVLLLLILTVGLAGCGGGGGSASSEIPAIINLTPSGNVSIDVGATQSFTASAQNFKRQTLLVPISFHSSNTAVLTVANSGLACAGSWDSLTSPVVCTPGSVGVAQVTATSRGVSSPPVTVFVHQHVDSIIITEVPPVTPPPLPGQCPPPQPRAQCLSLNQTMNLQAAACSRGRDITSTVGTFTWQSVQPNVVKLNSTATGLQPNQVQATANVPGLTQVFATASGVNSLPMAFTTCAVQSISLAIEGTSGNSFSISAGGSKTIIPTVVDTLGITITGTPLTWCSSEPASVSVGSTNCSSNTSNVSARATQAGAATILASCTPPTCNIGFENTLRHTLPIYPTGVVNATVTGTGQSTSAWVTSTACGTTSGCTSLIVSIAVPADTFASAGNLPETPNSLVFDRQGSRIFLGSSAGLMVANPTQNPVGVSKFVAVTGKVLAVSPNGNKVIVSDPGATSPLPRASQVFVFDATSNTAVNFPIVGATAADFSPDGLKAYILAGNKLYVYSTLDALQTIPLTAPASDVSFLSIGAFAYVAGEEPSKLTARKTCDNTIAKDSAGNDQIIPITATPSFIKSLPDATKVLAVVSPGIDLIGVNTTPIGCAPPTPALPSGLPTVSDGPVDFFNLGQGDFVPTQLLMSPGGARAYVLTSNLANILIFDIGSKTSSAIALAHCAVQAGDPKDTCTTDNAIPIQATLTPDGNLLYVAAKDGAVHVVNVQTGEDVQQIAIPVNLSALQGGLCTGGNFTCHPDLIAMRP